MDIFFQPHAAPFAFSLAWLVVVVGLLISRQFKVKRSVIAGINLMP